MIILDNMTEVEHFHLTQWWATNAPGGPQPSLFSNYPCCSSRFWVTEHTWFRSSVAGRRGTAGKQGGLRPVELTTPKLKVMMYDDTQYDDSWLQQYKKKKLHLFYTCCVRKRFVPKNSTIVLDLSQKYLDTNF